MAKLQEVQKFYTLDNHLLNLAAVVINNNFFNKLKPEDQKIIEFAARQSALALLGIVLAKESDDLKAIAKAGVKIYTPTPAEFQMFRDRVQGPVLKELQGKVSQEWIDKLFSAVKKGRDRHGDVQLAPDRDPGFVRG